MAEHRWLDRTQPQTLQSAVMLAYLNVAFSLFYLVLLGSASGLITLALLGAGVGAYGIANEKKWGYITALVCVVVYCVLWLSVLVEFGVYFTLMLNLLIGVVMMILLLHPMSRSYARIWFH